MVCMSISDSCLMEVTSMVATCNCFCLFMDATCFNSTFPTMNTKIRQPTLQVLKIGDLGGVQHLSGSLAAALLNKMVTSM